jgi:hypothetical protein
MGISLTGCGEEQGWRDGDSRGCDRGMSGEGDGDWGHLLYYLVTTRPFRQVVAEMESRRPCDTDDRLGPSSDRVDVVPTLPLGMTNLARGPSWVGGRHFVPRG